MDKPLNTWSYEELRQKMDLIAQTLDGSIDLPNEAVDATPVFDNAHAAGQDTAQPLPNHDEAVLHHAGALAGSKAY